MKWNIFNKKEENCSQFYRWWTKLPAKILQDYGIYLTRKKKAAANFKDDEQNYQQKCFNRDYSNDEILHP